MNDWGGFGAILKEARSLDEAARVKPLAACPVCGERLDFNDRGDGNCPLGHYRVAGAR